jgi:hypothetical protein
MFAQASPMAAQSIASDAASVWVPTDPDYAARVRASFDKQLCAIMQQTLTVMASRPDRQSDT